MVSLELLVAGAVWLSLVGLALAYPKSAIAITPNLDDLLISLLIVGVGLMFGPILLVIFWSGRGFAYTLSKIKTRAAS